MFKFTKEILDQLLSVEDYYAHFQRIIDKEYIEKPYDDDYYLSYTEGNLKRIQSSVNKIDLQKKLYNELNKDGFAGATWVLITEPWCGDASFFQGIIEAISLVGNIDLKISLRDSEPKLIDNYLTNGGKSIPILVALNAKMEEAFVWGPRPKALQELMLPLVANKASLDEKIKLAHHWYRKNGSEHIQEEIYHLIKKYHGSI